jgi:fumarate reductase flavoprotein subunit
VEYDVVVLGGGGAGLAAAVEASSRGASVLLLEAADKLGGSTAMSAGVYYATGTRLQREAGVEDSVERTYKYYQALNQWALEPSLVMRFCTESAPTLDWLIGMGVNYTVESLYVSGVDDTKRGHQPAGGGQSIIDALSARAASLGVEIRLNSRVTELIADEGAVRGVILDGRPIGSTGVVIATGGFGANDDLMAEYFEPAMRHPARWRNYFGSNTSRGDGITMTREIKAAVFGKGFGLLNWTAGFTEEPADFCPSWLVFVNLDGKRFMAENAAYAISGDLMSKQRESRCYAILDEAARARSVDQNDRRDKLGVGEYTWGAETIQKKYEEGYVLRAGTLSELAKLAGISAETFVNTIGNYNADVRSGADRHFLKQGELREIKDGPFYAVDVRPSAWGTTFPGLQIDADARVYSESARPIPGLFAAGEASGGVLGTHYVGGGNSVANAIIFGRIAGRTAALRPGS